MDELVRDPDILGGVPVFRGTRVPVKNLFDYLVNGSSIKDFLDDFPTVAVEQVKKILMDAESHLAEWAA